MRLKELMPLGSAAAISIFIILNLSFTNAIQIQCGKSFFPCNSTETELKLKLNGPTKTSKASSPHKRVHGIQNAAEQNPIKLPLSEQTLRSASKQSGDEYKVMFNENNAKPLDLRHPLAASVSQYSRLHPLSEKAKRFSEPAYYSVILTRRLKKLGISNYDFQWNNSANTGKVRCPHDLLETCPPTPYRSLSGYCNNVQTPLWGTASEPMQRFMQNAYFDGISIPRKNKGGFELPNARQISVELFQNAGQHHSTVTELMPFWMYFVATDISNLVPNQCIIKGESQALPCCLTGFTHDDCDSIDVNSNDAVYSRAQVTCIPHARTLAAPRPNCRLGSREQSNQVSSFLDASTIYGSSTEDLAKIRESNSARLLSTSYQGVADLPSQDPKSGEYCESEHPKKRCFQSGTGDINLLPGVAALHTLWLRQHNHVADKLKEINRHWTTEKIFEETRKIVIAQIQHITYNEFLPIVIGHDFIKDFELGLKNTAYDSNYDMDLDGSAFNEFATIILPITFSWLSTQSKPFTKQFNNPDPLYEKNGLENIFK